MTVYTDEVNIYNTDAIAQDIEDAGNRADNYITEISAADGVKVHSAGNTSTFLQIASTFIDFVRGGASLLKLWVDGTAAKVRVGLENGFNTKMTSNKIAFCLSDDELASIEPASRYIYPAAWDAAMDTGYWQDDWQDGDAGGNALSFNSVLAYGEERWGSAFDTSAAWGYKLKGHVYVSGAYVQVLARLSDIRNAVASSYTGTPYAFFSAYSAYWLRYINETTARVYTGSSYLSNYVRIVSVSVGDGEVMDMSVGLNVHGPVHASGALSTGNPTLTRGNLGFDAGSVTIEAAANSVTDSTVAFSTNANFSSAPVVVVGFFSSSAAAAFGGLSCSVYGVTATGCKVRVFNSTSSARVPAIEWIAIGS